MSFISEFTSDIRHIKGKFNVAADALSRINIVEKDDQHKEGINFEKLAHAQEASDEMASYHTATTGLVLKDTDIGPSTLLCGITDLLDPFHLPQDPQSVAHWRQANTKGDSTALRMEWNEA